MQEADTGDQPLAKAPRTESVQGDAMPAPSPQQDVSGPPNKGSMSVAVEAQAAGQPEALVTGLNKGGGPTLHAAMGNSAGAESENTVISPAGNSTGTGLSEQPPGSALAGIPNMKGEGGLGLPNRSSEAQLLEDFRSAPLPTSASRCTHPFHLLPPVPSVACRLMFVHTQPTVLRLQAG